jgi:trehalose/maltose transport system substrate-binding protein
MIEMWTIFMKPGTNSRTRQVRNRRPDLLRASLRFAQAAALLALVLALFGCKKPSEPVTISFLDPEGLLDLGDRRMVSDSAINAFTAETGIKVNHLPTPQDNRAQLQLIRDLFQSGASTPDVYGIDSIWPGMLAQYLVDLKTYFPADMPNVDPEVLSAYMIDGKLTGVPYHPNSSVLYYRVDLLRKYGYSAPPKTWDDLEKMALRIQKGERAEGKKDFWGFVFPGTTRESLTHIALEWQVTENGGHTIEPNKIVTVNNPNAIHAWERGAHWVGWISPPSVPSYTEWDASNAFWISGDAAFQRGWADYFQRHPTDEPFKQDAGVTSVPHGKGPRVSTLGGWALGVSKFSVHQAEAIKFVEFLRKRETQLQLDHAKSGPLWKNLQLVELPKLLDEAYPWARKPGDTPGGILISRPSAVSGANYEAVSRAYAEAVHSVLTRQATAPAAAAQAEKELMHITGFAAGKP